MSMPMVLDMTCAMRGSTPLAAAFNHAGPSSIAPPAPAAFVRNSRRERTEELLFNTLLILSQLRWWRRAREFTSPNDPTTAKRSVTHRPQSGRLEQPSLQQPNSLSGDALHDLNAV
jgi:hypothetical protein